MTQEQFEDCRDNLGNINLIDAFRSEYVPEPTYSQREFLQEIMDIHPIRSRQLAAIALATAKHTLPSS